MVMLRRVVWYLLVSLKFAFESPRLLDMLECFKLRRGRVFTMSRLV